MIWKNLTAFIGSVALIIGCSGGGGGGNVAEGGIGGTGMSVGVVTDFGSIVVNGVHYLESSGTVLIVDDNIPTMLGSDLYSDYLHIGMVVTVRDHSASVDGEEATAVEVEYQSLLRGPVTVPLDSDANTMEVINQPIFLTSATHYYDENGNEVDKSIASGWIDRQIEVSGFIAADGTSYLATYIKDEGPAASASRVEGIVSATAPTQIGGLTLSGANSAIFNIGDRIRAEGFYFTSTDTLSLTEDAAVVGIDLSNRLEGDRIEVEGMTSGVVDVPDLLTFPYKIQVAGVDVWITATTEFERGTVLMLADDIRIEAEGAIDASGDFIAAEIEFEEEQFDFTAAAMSYSAGPPERFTIFGQPVAFNGLTRFIDDPTAGCSAATPANCGGDPIEVEVQGGYDGDSGELLASEIRLRSDTLAPDPEILEGVVEAISGTAGSEVITVAGIDIDTATLTGSSDFRDRDDVAIGRSAFFDQLLIGDTVKAKGVFNGPGFGFDDADSGHQLELED